MSETYTGKSPRNARIKIDYTGESPSVKFSYPRKDGVVGSMFMEFLLLWIMLLYFSTFFFGVGFSFGYDQGIATGEDEKPLLIPEEEALIEYVEYRWYVYEWQGITLQKIKNLGIGLLGAFFLGVIVIAPPLIANKRYSKKWYPRYAAWRVKKKYVKFTEEDVKVETINGKKVIYVEIPYFENIILNYHGKKDFSKYLDIIEIQEHNFKIEELSKGRVKKRKNYRNVKKQNEWYWYAKFYFSKRPTVGELEVIFK